MVSLGCLVACVRSVSRDEPEKGDSAEVET